MALTLALVLFDHLPRTAIHLMCAGIAVALFIAFSDFVLRMPLRGRIVAGLGLIAICAAIALRISYYSIGQLEADERADVREKLTGSLHMTSLDSWQNSEFTVTNNSAHDVLLLGLRCLISTIRTDRGSGRDMGTGLSYRITLRSGGDAETLACPSGSNGHFTGFLFPRGGHVECADETLTVVYALKDQPSKMQEKRYRYVFRPGGDQWSPTAIDDPPFCQP